MIVRILRLVTTMTVLSAPAFASPQGPRADGPTIARAVDSLAQEAISAGIAPAIGIAITLEGRTIYARSHGMADADARVRASDATLWYVASTSKSFTGFGVSLLADQGVLRFDAPITTLLPGVRWPDGVDASQLTLARFLSHTHHLNDNAVVSSAAFTGAIPESRWPELVRLATPGSPDLVYSNFGYNIAAMAIDRLRPEGWRAFLERHVYAPAGLRETYARVSGLDPARIARPHRLRTDGTYRTEPFFKVDATMNSAGGHVATLHDLARWTIVHMDSGRIDGQQVFPATAIARSHQLIARHTVGASRRFATFDREGWGAGWDLGTYEGERMVSRFGGYHTTRTHLSFLPSRRMGVVALTTGGLGSSLTDVIAAFAYDLRAGRTDARSRVAERMGDLRTRLAASRTRVAADEAERATRQRQALLHPIASFAATFVEPSFGEVQFTLTRDRLTYRWGAQYGPVEIMDAARNQMRVEIAGSGNVVTFSFDSAGQARAIQLQGVTFTRRP